MNRDGIWTGLILLLALFVLAVPERPYLPPHFLGWGILGVMWAWGMTMLAIADGRKP